MQVAPVFAIHGLPMTPTSGERFDGPGNSVTRTELAALFAVIGTPSWRCIESVANPAWRRYLRKITGRCVDTGFACGASLGGGVSRRECCGGGCRGRRVYIPCDFAIVHVVV
jgi:hypothetical protein